MQAIFADSIATNRNLSKLLTVPAHLPNTVGATVAHRCTNAPALFLPGFSACRAGYVNTWQATTRAAELECSGASVQWVISHFWAGYALVEEIDAGTLRVWDRVGGFADLTISPDDCHTKGPAVH